MSWTDRVAIQVIKQLRDEFNVTTLLETGTFKGINSFVHANNFKHVITCDINVNYLSIAKEKLKDKKNVMILKKPSPEFLREFVKSYKDNRLTEYVIIYLDAHFYNPNLKNKFVVLDELKALKGFKNCIVIIHDFDNGMGHITYENQPLNLKLLRRELWDVNPMFNFYTNTPDFSNIFKKEELWEIDLENDADAIDNINYAWTSERLTKRGILYCIPGELDLKKYKLIKWN